MALAVLLFTLAALLAWKMLRLAALSTAEINSEEAAMAASLSPAATALSAFLRSVLMRLLIARLRSVRTTVWRARLMDDL